MMLATIRTLWTALTLAATSSVSRSSFRTSIGLRFSIRNCLLKKFEMGGYKKLKERSGLSPKKEGILVWGDKQTDMVQDNLMQRSDLERKFDDLCLFEIKSIHYITYYNMTTKQSTNTKGGKKGGSKSKPKSVEIVKEVPMVESRRQVIVILENAGLELSRRTKKPELLNFQDNEEFIRDRLKLPPELFQPQAIHQCLLNLMDSPLNKDGHLKVFVKTFKGRLIQMNMKTRIPRTYQRFSPLIAQLLSKQKIFSPEDGEVLLKVSREPLDEILPKNCFRIGVQKNKKVTNVREHLDRIDLNNPIAFFVRMSDTNLFNDELEKVHEEISVSKYPMSPCYAMTRIILSFEDVWSKA